MAGLKYWRGKPLLFRDSHASSNNFGLGNSYLNAVPRPKFMFYVRFMRTTGSAAASENILDSRQSSALNWSRGISFVIKSMDRPQIKYDVETLNQYNKKRVVQKKIEYGNVIIRFHDTVDNKAAVLHDDYNKFYYADSRSLSVTNWSNDQTAGRMYPAVGGRWGYNPQPRQDNPNLGHYFSHIEIYQVYGGYYNQFNLVNPKIVSWDPDEMTFQEGGLTHEIAMHLAYEGIIYQSYGTKLTASLIQEMGLDRTSFYEPENGPLGTILGLFNPQANPYGVSGAYNTFGTPTGNLQIPSTIPSIEQIIGGAVGGAIASPITGGGITSGIQKGFLSSFGIFDYANPGTISTADLTRFAGSSLSYDNSNPAVQYGTRY